MKKTLLILLSLLLALPLCAGAEAPAAAQDATLTVTGSATVSLEADYARVTVGVSTTAATVEEAIEANGAAIRAVIAALQAAGVAEEDVATSHYMVSSEYDYSVHPAVLAGYTVSNQLTVILRDMSCIGAVLDDATRAGANSIYNIEFLSTQSPAAQDEALTYAVAEAYRKAQLLAAAAGLELGDVIALEETPGMVYTSARTYASSAAKGDSSNVILPDETTVSATVTLVIELK